MYKLLNNEPDISERSNMKLEDLKEKEILEVYKYKTYYFIGVKNEDYWVFDTSRDKMGYIFIGPFLVKYEDKATPVDVEEFKKNYLN